MTTACRICESRDLRPVLSLGRQPLANALLREDQLREPEPTFPLDLVLCTECSLLQITETVSPELLFREYSYFSSFSDTMVLHAKRFAEETTRVRGLTAESLVVEVASNDGYLLQHFAALGVNVLGIEPATNVARAAEAKGVRTVNEFFDRRLAERLAGEGVRADVLVGNNVLAHVAQLHDFVEGVRVVLAPDGLASFEVPYVRDTIDGCEFDQIYHEHLCYYSLTALARLFGAHGLEVVDAERLSIHGGSLRVSVCHEGAGAASDRARALFEEEAEWGVKDPARYARFAERVWEKRDALLGLLGDLKASGKRIAAYGAAAKGTVLLNAFGIGSDLLDYVVDRSPHKQGHYTPGSRLPIYAPERLLEDRPDYALILVWNFRDEVVEQQAAYRAAGGRFIVPVPEIEVL